MVAALPPGPPPQVAANLPLFFCRRVEPADIVSGSLAESEMPSPGQQLRDLIEAPDVAIVTYPRILTAAAIKGIQNALGALRESLDAGEVIDRPDLLVSFDEINNLMGLPQLRELEGRHLSAADRERKYGRAAK
jgi:hypothetical protein